MAKAKPSPEQDELQKKLVTFMTTKGPSGRGNAMHGGTAAWPGGRGRHEAQRNDLADKVAASIATLFPKGVSQADYEEIEKHLGEQLQGKSRTAFAEEFGAAENGAPEPEKQRAFVHGVLEKAGVEASPVQQQAAATVTTPVQQRTEVAADRPDWQARNAEYGRGRQEREAAAREKVVAAARVVTPLSPMQQMEAMQAQSAVFTNSLAASKKIVEQFKNNLTGLAASQEFKQHVNAYADQFLASVKSGSPLDVKYQDTILGGESREIQLAVLGAVQQKLAGANLAEEEQKRIQGWCAERQNAVEEGKAFNPARREARQERAATASLSDEEALRRLEEDLNSPSPTPMASTRTTPVREEGREDFSMPTPRASRSPTPMADAATQFRGTTMRDTPAPSPQDQAIANERAALGSSFNASVELFNTFAREIAAHNEESSKSKTTVPFSDAYRAARDTYDKEFQGHIDAYAKMLVVSNLPVQEHDAALLSAPPQVQRAVLEAVKREIDAKGPEVPETLRNWHAERTVAVQNDVAFDPRARTTVEQRFMAARLAQSQREAEYSALVRQVEEEKQSGKVGLFTSAPSQKAADEARKLLNEAAKVSERDRQTLQMEQNALRQESQARAAQGVREQAMNSGELQKQQAEAADRRLADLAKTSYVSRLLEDGYRDRREGITGTGLSGVAANLLLGPEYRLRNAAALTSLAETMRQDAWAMSRDLSQKTSQMQDGQVGVRARIAKVQPAALKADVRAKVLQDVLAAGKPPFSVHMLPQERKNFYDAVEKRTQEELGKLATLHKELNAQSMLSTDAVTKMERAHKEMITISEKALPKLKAQAEALVQTNQALAEKDKADKLLKDRGGFTGLTPEEQVQALKANAKVAALGLLDETKSRGLNQQTYEGILRILPPAEQRDLQRFKLKSDAAQYLNKQDKLQKQYEEAKKSNAKMVPELEAQMAQNKAWYGNTLNQLGKLTAEEHEATTQAVEQQKELATFSGKVQGLINDLAKKLPGVTNGPFAEGSKVLDARKLAALEAQQKQLNNDFEKVTKMADQHRDSYLGAKHDYEAAKVKVDDQLKAAEEGVAKFRAAGQALREGPRTQLAEAMYVMQKVDADKEQVLARVGRGGFRGDVDAASILTAAERAHPPKQEAGESRNSVAAPTSQSPRTPPRKPDGFSRV